MLGDESYAGSQSFTRFQAAVEEVLGFPFVVPAHQGRGAEGVFFGAVIDPGEIVPSNAHFDTTRAHIEIREGIALDLPCGEAGDPTTDAPFKGNMDVARLVELLDGPDGDKVSIVMLTLTNNAGGGQPVSLANIREVAQVAREREKKLVLDIARFAENAWFIKEREAGYADMPLPQIVREMMADADGVLMSAKKDAIANIGGFVAIRDDEEFFTGLQMRGVVTEGFPTYGGLAGRDLEVIAVGLYEVMDEEYLRHRIHQVAYLGETLAAAGASVVQPTGGHAVYLNAGETLPHIPPAGFPGLGALVRALPRGRRARRRDRLGHGRARSGDRGEPPSAARAPAARGSAPHVHLAPARARRRRDGGDPREAGGGPRLRAGRRGARAAAFHSPVPAGRSRLGSRSWRRSAARRSTSDTPSSAPASSPSPAGRCRCSTRPSWRSTRPSARRPASSTSRTWASSSSTGTARPTTSRRGSRTTSAGSDPRRRSTRCSRTSAAGSPTT